ncbi:MAG: cupin domain-containing protein, partial [Cyanobacteria bacterium J06635_15]
PVSLDQPQGVGSCLKATGFLVARSSISGDNFKEADNSHLETQFLDVWEEVMSKPIINIADLNPQPRPAAWAATGAAAERFDARMCPIGAPLGAQKLGYNLTVVPPGKRAYPFHNHRVNEEMFYILQGTGEVRIGDATYPIRPGDIIACPAGGPETAHQIINTGDADLKFLAVSTKLSPEIAEYPDSDKFGVIAEFPTGVDKQPDMFLFVGRENIGLDYWEGE